MPLPKDPVKAELWKQRQRASQLGKSRNSGINNPFYGKKHTSETKEKISLVHKGKKRPPRSKEWCERLSMAHKEIDLTSNLGVYVAEGKRPWVKIDNRGEKNPKWKGGITPEIKRIRQSPEYAAWRAQVFERDGYTCQNCGYSQGHILRAHHIKPFSIRPELRFDVNNGITYCEACHIQIHKGQGNMPPRKRQEFPKEMQR